MEPSPLVRQLSARHWPVPHLPRAQRPEVGARNRTDVATKLEPDNNNIANPTRMNQVSQYADIKT